MIRRPHPRSTWSSRKMLVMLGLFAWMVLLLMGDYRITHSPASQLLDVVKADTKEEMASAAPNRLPSDAERSKAKNRTQSSPVIVPWDFIAAVETFEKNLAVVDGLTGNPNQPTDDFTDVIESTGFGVPLPHDVTLVARNKEWEACDQSNADFVPERDALCQSYVSNLNNMRYIKAMSSRLLHGRTIKFRVRYAHKGIEAVVKVSQRKFYYEAASEYVAYIVDRTLNFSRVPTSAFVLLPIVYMKSATAYSPFFSQWIQRYIFEYNYSSRNFLPCAFPGFALNENFLCSHVTVQLWMNDVHSALSTFLALPYEYDAAFAAKYYTIGHQLWPPKNSRLRAIGDVLDRFIFDFLIGNTDRGMNEHNNFVYGGCNFKTVCQPPPKMERTSGLAKYAFIDHGSSFYSHKEPKENAFFGDIERIPICRFRSSTYEAMRLYRQSNSSQPTLPFVMRVRERLSPYIFRVIKLSVIEKMQVRLEKILKIVERCLETYSPSEVFSLPAYWEIHVPEEGSSLETVDTTGSD